MLFYFDLLYGTEVSFWVFSFRHDPFPLTHKDAAWLLARVSETRQAGKSFWEALSPYDCMAVLDSKCMRLPRKDRQRIEYKNGHRLVLEKDCDEHYKRTTGRSGLFSI